MWLQVLARSTRAISSQTFLKLSPSLCNRDFCHSAVRKSEDTGRIASKEPFCVSLKADKKYSWCKCGLSKKQPFCDGSHKQSSLSPLRFTCEEDNPEAFLCGCKQTGTPPYCDGTHATPLVQDHKD